MTSKEIVDYYNKDKDKYRWVNTTKLNCPDANLCLEFPFNVEIPCNTSSTSYIYFVAKLLEMLKEYKDVVIGE